MSRSSVVKRIFIVNSNRRLGSNLAQLIARAYPSVEIQRADSGEEALVRMADRPADLVLTEVRLPGLNGFELARKIRDSNCAAAIILLTDVDLPEYVDAAYASGIEAVLNKSDCTVQSISALINSATESRINAEKNLSQRAYGSH